MSSGDAYKEFDTTSIVSKDTVSVGKLTLQKRYIFFGLVIIILLLIIIILAIILADRVGKTGSASSSAQTGGNGDYSDYCSTTPCLKTAYYEKSIMNESADPCVNFYQFACGAYSSVYSPNPVIPDQSPFKQIITDNAQKLLYLMEYEPDRDEEQSYERKLRHFFKSCYNHFDRMELQGQPLIDQVFQPFGDLYLLGRWNSSTFSLHDQLKKVHIDFWTPAFFTISLSTDSHDWNKKVLELNYGGLGMEPYKYGYSYYQDFYRVHMTTQAQYVVRDANMAKNSSRIKQFVRDVLDVETALANIVYSLSSQEDPHAVANRMSLGSLTLLTNNTVDFVDYFKGQIPGLTFTFNENTAVSVLRKGFFHSLGPLLMNFTSSDDGKRKLHNYLVWQLINRYSKYLSWDYVHAKRQFTYDLYGEIDSSSGEIDCFSQALDSMKEAVGAVFVKEYINEKDKQEATNILNVIKEQMMEGLKSLEWMSSDNKNDAITKIRESLYSVGYPDYMVDDAYMDSLYINVNITEYDFFANVLNLNWVRRMRFRDVLSHPESKTMWPYHIVNPRVQYFNALHLLIATAAVFQYPLFAHNGPAYYNYGGMGTLLAANLFHAVDEYGSNYKLDKSNPGSWWTNFTQTHYLRIKECAINAQKGLKLGPYNITKYYQYEPNMTATAFGFAPEMLSETSGLRLALKAYKTKLATADTEKVPAGLSQYSLDKMFFVAYAQVHCHNTPPYTQVINMLNNKDLPGEYRVNLAVSQVPEFKDAFACQNGSPMVAETTCQLF